MSKSLKRILLTIIALAVVGGGSYALYLYYMPHRDVQASDAFAKLKATELLAEFTANKEAANQKYLSNDGDSKILIVEGRVHSITEDQNQQKVVLLKQEDAKVGVSCTFTAETNKNVDGIKEGDIVKVKGAITQGNGYDDLLELYDNALLRECDIVK